MSGHKDLDYAIIGGGISGLTLGIALHQRGVNVRIYEAAHHFGEIGAGIGVTPNAWKSMKTCHEGIFEAFEKVRTRNAWADRGKDSYEVWDSDGGDKARPILTLDPSLAVAAVHRAQFLDALINLYPKRPSGIREET